jgi:hypothetical protein
MSAAAAQSQSASGWPQKEVFLLTWSQADIALLKGYEDPRRVFGLLVAGLFEEQTNGFKKPIPTEDGKNVDKWACSIEAHETDGEHFHLAVKLKRRVRAYSVWKSLHDRGIKTHFSTKEGGYYGAYRYLTKHDTNFKVSDGHPVVPPKRPSSYAATAAQSTDADAGPSEDKPPAPTKKRRLSSEEIRKLIIENDLSTDLKLCAFASRMKAEGMPEVDRWVGDHVRPQTRVDTINTAFKLHTAVGQLAEQESLKVS